MATFNYGDVWYEGAVRNLTHSAQSAFWFTAVAIAVNRAFRRFGSV